MTKEEINLLVEAAGKGRLMAYTPYSKFKVGAAILMRDGKYMMGCNIENAAYGDCICAERSCMFHSHLSGYDLKKDAVAMCIIGDTAKPISPCGSCRQVMNELLPKDLPVYLTNLKGDIKEETVGSLLPYGFDDLD
jgi:cytidine deaminase